MVAARLPLVAIHALLNDRPFALVGHEETMQVKVEAVLYRGAVDFSHEAAGPRQGQPVNTDAFAGCCQFLRRAARMLAAATADMNAKLALQRGEPAFQRADDARGDPRRVPVHSHDSAKGLKPERVGESLQEFVAPIMVNDGLRDDRAERSHAFRQPSGNASAM